MYVHMYVYSGTKYCFLPVLLGNEVPIINIVARNSRLPTNEGYVSLILLYIIKC